MSRETIVLTGSEGSFSGLVEALRPLAIAIVERPLLRFAPPGDWSPLDQALARLSSYQALAFTSPRAAQAFRQRALKNRILLTGHRPEVWAVGAATAGALGDDLAPVRQPPSPGGAVNLAQAMLGAGVRGPVLFPCGDLRRDELPQMLRQQGVVVEEIVVYQTVLADATEARRAAAEATLLVVASPSVIELLSRACGPGERPGLVAVGQTTAAAADEAGWPPIAVAPAPSSQALAAAITGVLARR